MNIWNSKFFIMRIILFFVITGGAQTMMNINNLDPDYEVYSSTYAENIICDFDLTGLSLNMPFVHDTP